MGAVYSAQRIGGAPVFGALFADGGAVPSNTVAPAITGSAVQGQTLTASTGTWANGVTSYAYRWLRGASAISGATGSTYVLQAGDVGSQVRVGVIATNATGSSAEALSAQTAVVTATGDTTAPTLTGAISVSSLTSTSYTATCPVATDDTAVTGYQYRLNAGAWVTIAAAGRAVDITGRTPGATDALEMRAFDAVPNYSSALAASVVLSSATDTTAPTLTGPTGTATGATTASGTVTTNEAGGTLYRLASTNASELAATVKAAALASVVGASGVRTASFTGLAPETAYFAHYVHTDASGNDSAVASSASFTTSAVVVTSEPITLEEAKLAARVDADETALDLDIISQITAARQQAEQITGRRYVQTTERKEFASWPASTDLLHVYEATACAITWWDGAAWQPLDSAAYAFAPAGSGTVIAPAVGASWPTLGTVAVGPRVRVDLTSGPSNPATAPDLVKLYIKATVAGWVNNPDAIGRAALTANPLFDRLLDREIVF